MKCQVLIFLNIIIIIHVILLLVWSYVSIAVADNILSYFDICYVMFFFFGFLFSFLLFFFFFLWTPVLI